MQHPFHPDMRKRTLAMPEVAPPEPWKKVYDASVGGLMAVGFAPGTAQLLVLSSQGRGVVDGLTGERLARDQACPDSMYDPIRLIGLGIGPIADTRVPMCGDHGGGLPTFTRDGWWVASRCLKWPDELIVLARPGGQGEDFFRIGAAASIRALGFSECGRCLVLAGDYGDLTIFSRPECTIGDSSLGWGTLA